MKTIVKKVLSTLLIGALLLSVSVGLVGCEEESFTAGTYTYESHENKKTFGYKMFEAFAGIFETLGAPSEDVDVFDYSFSNETITFSVDESNSNGGVIHIQNPYEFENYDEIIGQWTKEDDEITAELYLGLYVFERNFEFKNGYLIMTVDLDELGTIEVKYKQEK